MSANDTLSQNEVRAELVKTVHDHWAFYLAEGIVLFALGAIAIIVPPIATLGVTIVIGWLFLASGTFSLAMSFFGRHARGFWWSLLSALLGIMAGFVLLARPGSGAVSLTLVLIAYFVVEGIVSILFGLEQRQHVSTWGWPLANGIVDIVLAGILFIGLPGTAAWALGLLVGIDMLFGGTALTAIAIHVRRLPDEKGL
jgi:uncharacterized membrane protein HdeD (DUF308 family)